MVTSPDLPFSLPLFLLLLFYFSPLVAATIPCGGLSSVATRCGESARHPVLVHSDTTVSLLCWYSGGGTPKTTRGRRDFVIFYKYLGRFLHGEGAFVVDMGMIYRSAARLT